LIGLRGDLDMRMFSYIHFSKPIEISPQETIEVARRYNTDRLFGIDLKKYKIGYPLRSTKELIKLILNGDGDKIYRIEWLYLITKKSGIDELSTKIGWEIWKYTFKNYWLLNTIIWRVVLIIDNEDIYGDILADCIINTSERSLNEMKKHGMMHDKLFIIDLLKKNKIDKIIKYCFNQKMTIKELLRKVNLPILKKTQKNINNKVMKIFCWMGTKKKTANQDLLIRYLKEMSIAEELNAVTELLNEEDESMAESYQQIVSWLSEEYNPLSGKEKYNRLSVEVRPKLRAWLGTINFKDFREIIEILTDDKNRYILGLEDWEVNQLKGRERFWSSYSTRFQNIRVLVPKRTIEVISGKTKIRGEIGVLKNDLNEETEVCIFNMDKLIIAEVFRGEMSETRFFQNNKNEIEKKLFEEEIGLKDIRSIKEVEIADHKYLWQYYCFTYLRKNDILPNDGLTHLNGLYNKENRRLMPAIGLRLPKQEMIKERFKKLKKWALFDDPGYEFIRRMTIKDAKVE